MRQYGTTSIGVIFGIAELVTDTLTSRIKADQGIEDDAEFWRLTTQLVRGVGSVHQAGVIHLAIQVRAAMCLPSLYTV